MRFTKAIVEAMCYAAFHRGARDALSRDFFNAPGDALQRARDATTRWAAESQAEVERLVAAQGAKAGRRK